MLKRRADGLYQKKIYVDGKPKIIYGKTQKEITQKLINLENERKAKQAAGELFTTWVDRWWEYHQGHIKYNTIESYKRPVADVLEYFSGMTIQEIKPSDIKCFLEDLESKKYSRQTVNLRYVVLCKTFDFAIEHDVDISNAARAVKLPKGLPKTTRETLTPDEIAAVQNSRNLFANFLLYTGCRRNEALAIQYKDIDFEKKTISVNKAVLWINNKPTITSTKSASGNRIIPLLSPLEELLKEQKYKKDDFLFSINGEPVERKQARMMWDKFRKETGLNITPHQFRHAFISIMYYAGIDVKTAQVIAGHSKADVTLNIYTHLANNQHSAARQKLNDFLVVKK